MTPNPKHVGPDLLDFLVMQDAPVPPPPTFEPHVEMCGCDLVTRFNTGGTVYAGDWWVHPLCGLPVVRTRPKELK